MVFSSPQLGNGAAHHGIGVGSLIAMDSVHRLSPIGDDLPKLAKSAPISGWRDQRLSGCEPAMSATPTATINIPMQPPNVGVSPRNSQLASATIMNDSPTKG